MGNVVIARRAPNFGDNVALALCGTVGFDHHTLPESVQLTVIVLACGFVHCQSEHVSIGEQAARLQSHCERDGCVPPLGCLVRDPVRYEAAIGIGRRLPL